MKVWFTAAELADAAVSGELEGLPTTQRGIRLLANREGWAQHRGLAKVRPGREGGGGLEYHIELLPAPTRLRYLSQHASIATTDTMVPIPEDPDLSGRGRQTRDARMAILRAADRYKAGNRLGQNASDHYFSLIYNAGEVEIAPWVRQIVGKLSRRTLARWREAARKGGTVALGYDPAASRKDTGILARAEGGAVRDLMLALLGKNPFLSAEHIRNEVTRRFGEQLTVNGVRRAVPTLRAFQFALCELRASYRNELMKLTDPDGYRSRVEFVATGTSRASRLNEVWQIDASPLDAIMLSGKRHTIYAAIDVFSRRVMILLTETPRAAAVGLLLRKCLTAWGVPERIKTDNGSDFTAHATQRLLTALDIEVELAPPYTPRAKAIVERVIGTFQRDFAATLPGFVGHSVADRKVIENRKSFSRRLGLDDVHLFDADMTEAEAAAYADRWATEIYAHTSHEGLGGQTPFAAAAAYQGRIRRITNEAALDILLAPVVGRDGQRMVTKTGILVDGAHYLIGTVMPGTRVLCRMDPADLGRLWVFTPDGETFLGHAVAPELRGLDPVQTAAKVKAEQKAYLEGRLKPIRAQMRKIGPRDVADAQAEAARRRAGSLVAFRRPSDTHDTAPLDAAARALDANEAAPLSAAVRERHEEIKREITAGATAAKVSRLPETPQQRFRKALEIEKRIAAGEQVEADEARWLGGYQAGPEYRAQRMLFADFEGRQRASDGGASE